MRELGIPLNEYTLGILINCFCRMKRVDFGFAIFGFFFKCGYRANVAAFNTLINGYILQDKTADAVKLFMGLTKGRDITPNEVT
ncbi:hypothetical protein RHMOL_Rhmol02G0055100 [Rhododendron molle]|uniref:Uncharacterized protein n=1 Tax=Rhododendron molle TaxID=49168 RepID=A0ACC0PM85_RHOML|nr:hypothetical protein RHMOL_Rhmol02G0055100 [Rhododendron molle]